MPVRIAGWTALVVATYEVADRTLPSGVPAGIVLQGVITGGLSSMVAMGLILLYRAARIINFAQVALGAVGATLAVALYSGRHWPYLACVACGVGLSLLTGVLVDAFFHWRFARAPRLIVIVATIGLLEVLGAAQVVIPGWIGLGSGGATFTMPLSVTFSVSPLTFTSTDIVALALVPVMAIALWWFLTHTDTGLVVRGAADSGERALLLGLPVRRGTRSVWMIASGLSAVAAILTAGILPTTPGTASSPVDLLAPLAAAVLARFKSMPAAVAWSLVIGVVQQAVFWSYHSGTYADVVVVLLIFVGLGLQPPGSGGEDSGTAFGDWLAVREVRRIPRRLATLPEVRWTRTAGVVVLVGAAITVPFVLTTAQTGPMAQGVIYAIIAVSLVVLTGWSGQVSLGQFAFAGLGAAATGALLVHDHADLFVALAVAAGVGAAGSCLVSLPTLRLSGVQLAVVTMAFAVLVSEWFLSPRYFPTLNPSEVGKPLLFGRLTLASHVTLYEVCLAGLFLSLLLAWNFRRSRVGRAVVAFRDSPRGAASFGIEPWRQKLTSAALAGALAGMAGGLYVISVGGTASAGIDPTLSLTIFSMAVIGGLGSLSGALFGAAYIWGVTTFLPVGWALLASGAGLLVLLAFFPEGISGLVFRVRDLMLRGVARRRGIELPTPSPLGAEPGPTPPSPGIDSVLDGVGNGRSRSPVLAVVGMDVSFRSQHVLHEIELSVGPGEAMAIVGTNGAGKSTLLRAVAGLVGVQEGAVYFEGADVSSWAPAARVQAGLVTVLGGSGMFRSLTVAENLRLAGWTMRRRHRDPAGLQVIERQVHRLFPVLARRSDVLAGQLSGGERQMLNLSQALLCRPKVILIDELSLGLAPVVVQDLVQVLRALLAGGISVLLVEQSISVAAEVAERAVFLERGSVRYRGPTLDLLDRSDLVRPVFLQGDDGPSSQHHPPASAPVRPTGDHPAGSELALLAVGKRFGGVSAITEVSLELGRGEILGIVGANGAGKTTLLDLGSGFETPDRGQVLLRSVDMTGISPARRAAAGLGRIFQDTWLFPTLTVAETVAVAADRHVAVRDPLLCILRTHQVARSERMVADRVSAVLDHFKLTEWEQTPISELSTGTRRIVALACALVFEPRVLLLDEPSSGLAQRECEQLVPALRRLRELTDSSFLIIDHDLAFMEAVSERLAVMHLGELLLVGEPAEVLAHPEVVAAYTGASEPSPAPPG